jgi:hypothetical protein
MSPTPTRCTSIPPNRKLSLSPSGQKKSRLNEPRSMFRAPAPSRIAPLCGADG